MTELNIFDSAQKAAELLKLKTASDNISSQPVKKLSKLKQYIIDKYDEISHEKKSLSQALIQSISDIETSIYRYETLKKSNFAEAAASEKSNILKSIDNVLNYSRNLQDDSVLLKGAVSNTRYVWRSSKGSCPACQALDETEYVLKEDIPYKPHPNCKCTVEVIKDDTDEMCDCRSLYDKIDRVSEAVDAVIPALNYINGTIAELIVIAVNTPAASLGYQILDEVNTALEAYHDFQRNKAEMISSRGYDKYYHAKANCEAAKRGLSGEAVAYLASIGKEIIDIYTKTKSKRLTFIEALKDSLEDLQADFYGIEQSRKEGFCGDNIKNIGDIMNKF